MAENVTSGESPNPDDFHDWLFGHPASTISNGEPYMLVFDLITCSAVILYADWSITVRSGAVHTL